MLALLFGGYFYVGIIILVFSVIVRKFHLYQRFKDIKVIKIPFVKEPAILTLAGQGMYWWFSIGILSGWITIMVFFTNLDTNIVIQRTTILETGHYLVWASIFLVYLRYGLLDPIKGAFIAGRYAAIHELVWYAGYFWANPKVIPEVSSGYFPFFVFCACLTVSSFILFPNAVARNKMIVFLVATVVFDGLWVESGFPLTVDLVNGKTDLYPDLMTNLLENNSWIFPALSLL